MADHKEELYYPLIIAIPHYNKQVIEELTQIAREKEVKPYVLIYEDAVILATTDMSENTVQAIEVLRKAGLKVHTFGGSPTPPPCVPKGCP